MMRINLINILTGVCSLDYIAKDEVKCIGAIEII